MSDARSIEFLGINKYIHDIVLRDQIILEGFKLTNAKREIRSFLGAHGFENRRKWAISISNKALKRHGKGKTFHPFLSRLAEIETGVQQYNPVLRDHISHSVYVFLLGLSFMSRLGSVRIDPLSWKIASLLHDIGYPLQLFSDSIKKYLNLVHEYKSEMSGFGVPINYLVSMQGLEVLKFSDDDAFHTIEGRLEDWGIRLDLQDICLRYQCQGRVNHGILSALIVMNLIDSLYANNNPKREESKILDDIDWGKHYFDTQIVDAVSAMSVHNILEEIDQISFENSPIAYLLILCDNLQQWDRYSPGQRVYDPNSVDIKFGRNQIACKLALSESRIHEIQEVVGKKLQAQAFNLHVQSSHLYQH